MNHLKCWRAILLAGLCATGLMAILLVAGGAGFIECRRIGPVVVEEFHEHPPLRWIPILVGAAVSLYNLTTYVIAWIRVREFSKDHILGEWHSPREHGHTLVYPAIKRKKDGVVLVDIRGKYRRPLNSGEFKAK